MTLTYTKHIQNELFLPMKALPYFSEQIPLGPVPHAQDLNATETSKMLNIQVAPMSQTLLTSGLIAPLSPFHTQ